jgi:hypothetical protein
MRFAMTVSFDAFNDPALVDPALVAATVGDTVTVSFPPEATLVLAGEASADEAVEKAIAES